MPGILTALKTLWGAHGSEPFSGTTYSNLISPYITAYEVEADYLTGATSRWSAVRTGPSAPSPADARSMGAPAGRSTGILEQHSARSVPPTGRPGCAAAAGRPGWFVTRRYSDTRRKLRELA